MKKLLMLAAMWLTAFSGLLNSAIVETRPSPLQESSKDVVVVYHSDQGNGGLKGFTGDMYAHTGVITNKSGGEWAYAPSKWGDNDAKYKLTKTGTDTWELNIGDIRTYYGISDAEEVVEKLCFVFRSADTKKEGKTENGGDIFVEVHQGAGLAMELKTDAADVMLAPGKVNVNASVTAAADIVIYLDGNEVAKVSGKNECTVAVDLSDYKDYAIKAIAKAGDETVEKTTSVLVAPAARSVAFPGGIPKMGVSKGEGDSYNFCIAAPGKQHVLLVTSRDNYKPTIDGVMNYQDYEGNRYFWCTVDGIGDDDDVIYYYLVDGTIKVGDPYSHLVLDPYSDKWLTNLWEGCPAYPYDMMDDTVLSVFNPSMDDYDWKHSDNFVIPGKDQLIIYELLLRDFTGNSSGSGTLSGLRGRLNYLQMLGVNAVELLPVMEFNGNNSWGYNTNFYMAPDKAYGSPAALKEIIDLCHSNGMAVILDIVFNQSDGLHPWYQMYKAEENPFYNAKAPHDYNVLNDWRQDNALVEQQWVDAITYWMTAYNVDGFRFDLVKGLGDNDSYSGGTEAYNASRVARMKRLHAAIKAVKPDGIHINENLAGPKEENEMAEDGQLNWSNMNNASCQVAMGYQSDASTGGFYAPNNGARLQGSTVSYAESHDEERMGFKQSKWGTDPVKGNTEMSLRRLGAVASLMLMTPGSHMIWQFQELGADQTTKNSDGSNNTDPKKVIWERENDQLYAGLHRTYTELNWIRRYNPTLFAADAQVKMEHSGWANGRFIRLTAGDMELLLMVNPQIAEAASLSYDVTRIAEGNMRVLAKSYGTDPKPSVSGGKVTCEVPAGAFVIVTTANTADKDNVVDEIGASDVRVYGSHGRIVIDGEYTDASVYTLQGRAVGLDGLNPGIYIAVVDGRSTKVIVR